MKKENYRLIPVTCVPKFSTERTKHNSTSKRVYGETMMIQHRPANTDDLTHQQNEEQKAWASNNGCKKSVTQDTTSLYE